MYRYIFDGLDLENKLILDAAIGIGESTLEWAKKINAAGGTSRIIGIDSDLDRDAIASYLGEWMRHVELRSADIFRLEPFKDGTFDIINCNDTIVFLSVDSRGLVSAMKEFRRVLKRGGLLVITSEIPVDDPSKPDNIGQWKRWNFAKAVYALNGKVWSREPAPEEVEAQLFAAGLTVAGTRRFPSAMSRHCLGTIEEWRGVMDREIGSAPWSPELIAALRNEADAIYRKVSTDQFLMCPELFVTKATKGGH